MGLPPLLDSLDDSNTLGRCDLLRITTAGGKPTFPACYCLRFDNVRYALDFSDSVTRNSSGGLLFTAPAATVMAAKITPDASGISYYNTDRSHY